MTENDVDFDAVCARAGFADLQDIVDAPDNVENAGAVGTGEGDPNSDILTLSCDQLQQTAAAQRAAEITELIKKYEQQKKVVEGERSGVQGRRQGKKANNWVGYEPGSQQYRWHEADEFLKGLRSNPPLLPDELKKSKRPPPSVDQLITTAKNQSHTMAARPPAPSGRIVGIDCGANIGAAAVVTSSLSRNVLSAT